MLPINESISVLGKGICTIRCLSTASTCGVDSGGDSFFFSKFIALDVNFRECVDARVRFRANSDFRREQRFPRINLAEELLHNTFLNLYTNAFRMN
jgi:hypothetical protein